ncbi:MAG: sugar ABC transporter substrate-binding protein [Succinivibrionaceae bacterium]|nr:sugar ABC transporter substrate-binding protein [Succinivibrionaceae bacterium]
MTKRALATLATLALLALAPAQARMVDEPSTLPSSEFYREFSNLSDSFYDIKAHDSISVGVSLMRYHEANPYFSALREAFKTSVAAIGGRLHLAEANADVREQITDIKNLISRGIDILIISPVEATALRDQIIQAHRNGIIVVSLDTRCRGPVDTHVGSDNYAAGALAADTMNTLVEEGDVAILGSAPQNSIQQRVAGFIKQLHNHPELKVVASVPFRHTREAAAEACERLLHDLPNVRAIFAVSDTVALGARDYIAKAGAKVSIVSVDGMPEVVNLLRQRDPILIATIGQHPQDEAKTAIGHALIRLWGGYIPSEIKVGVDQVNHKNAVRFSW